MKKAREQQFTSYLSPREQEIVYNAWVCPLGKNGFIKLYIAFELNSSIAKLFTTCCSFFLSHNEQFQKITKKRYRDFKNYT